MELGESASRLALPPLNVGHRVTSERESVPDPQSFGLVALELILDLSQLCPPKTDVLSHARLARLGLGRAPPSLAPFDVDACHPLLRVLDLLLGDRELPLPAS